MSSDAPAIRIHDLSKRYEIYEAPRDRLKQFFMPRVQRKLGIQARQYFREFWALKNLSFDIKRGETVGIIGRNGSGKSTLLQMICGTLTPTSGSVETSGRIAALLELGSGFNPEFTGRENIYLNASVLGLSQVQIEERFSAIVGFADIGDFVEQPVKSYSSGMTLRLAFAVIAHVDADILVVDEALAVGDAFFTQKCMRFLRDFMKTGTVLFVSHDTASIKSLCSRAVWLERGEVVLEGSAKEVCERYLEGFYESKQGSGSSTRLKDSSIQDEPVPEKDQRLAFINHTNLRNDIEIFKFDPEASSFGLGGARIVNVTLLDRDNKRLTWIVGGEQVTLQIDIDVMEDLQSPIVGFFVKDRLGQPLFGDNTFLFFKDMPLRCQPGERIQASFVFSMPLLPVGDYSITIAIANGTQENHQQQHWIHDAVVFKSESSSVSTGLIGIPMLDVKLQVLETRYESN